MKLRCLLLAFFCFKASLFAQSKLSNTAEISVMTIGPGNSLNDAFGHSAFRIKDQLNGIDWVYGYGEYDFDTPNFYLKFAQGKLNYLISRHKFSKFYNYYTYYDRTIKEQVLNLSTSEKQALYNYLQNNYKPENRAYLYDFFYDNCATKIRDVVEITSEEKINFNTPKDYQDKTFRTLIYEHVNKNSWGSLGIDVALGSVIDTNATPYEQMFLPKYIHVFFENATKGSSEKLVKSSSLMYQKKGTDSSGNSFMSPLVIMSIIGLLIVFMTYKDFKKNKRSKIIDTVIFSITGLIGVAVLLLWFATNHTATAYNYNLLWAFPLNLFALFQISKTQPKKWLKGYLKLLIIMMVLLAFHWVTGVQVFALTLIPIFIALVVRYIFLVKFYSQK